VFILGEFFRASLIFQGRPNIRGAQYLMGGNLKVVWAEFSTKLGSFAS
jgi:hypothetical protein